MISAAMPENEVGAEDAAVPQRLDRHAEHPGHNRVHGDGNRQDDERHDPDPAVEDALLALGSVPAEGERTVEPAHLWETVATDRDVRNQREIQVDRGRHQIGGDRTDVPEQR